MQGPVRVYLSLKQHGDSALIAATVVSSLLFASTPFLIPAIVDEFGVRLGTAGLLSTAQVAAFALTVFVAGRTLRTSRHYLTWAAVLSILANGASLIPDSFGPLLVVRMIAGAAAGVMIWLSWAKAMRTTGSMRNVAATGPLAVLIGTPIIGWLVSNFGIDAVFVMLAIVSVPVLFLDAEFARFRLDRSRLSPSRSNLLLILALWLSTTFGSSLFVFGAGLGADLGMSSLAVSLAYSANAAAGFFGARRPDRGSGWQWIIGVALAVVAVGLSGQPALFFLGMIVWGFSFWMATPVVLSAIKSWSNAPEERVGDTQSAMALGRALGPALGGLLIGDGSYELVAIVSCSGLLLTALLVWGVERYREDRHPPV